MFRCAAAWRPTRLAVAYEYTYGGRTYQVGEVASDMTDVNQALFVKALKNTSNNPSQGNWGSDDEERLLSCLQRRRRSSASMSNSKATRP